MSSTTPTITRNVVGERADLIETLRKHRGFLRFAVQGVSDEQARTRTTVSELTLGGLVKHVAEVEEGWAAFMVDGAAATPQIDWNAVDWSNPPPEVEAFQNSHRLLDGETLAGQLARYEEVARRTDELVAELDLDASHELPTAPWHEPGSAWSVRRTVLHIVAETAQHAGHADIIRESLDGQKTMG